MKASIQTMEEYRALYERSIKDPEGFWGELAEQLDWYKKWDKVLEYDFNKPEIKWFEGGKLNASYNSLDRHLNSWRSNKVALIWQGEPLEENRVFTYQQLHYHVCKFANVLKKFGVKKGDRVSIYLPMIPELPIAMLACARIGAIHSVVFAGFGSEVLRDRVNDCGAKILITADGFHSEGRIVQHKVNADDALRECPGVKKVIVVRRLGIDVPFVKERDRWWHEEMAKDDIQPSCDPVSMDAEDILFILYTSGSKGKPNGVIHTTGGYLLFVQETMRWVFDIKEEDVFFCTADIGSITGHSYVVYAPLALGVTTVMFEAVPTYPNPDRFWEIVERYKVSVFYTTPTAIRTFMREDEAWVKRRGISSLRLLGSVDEPITPEAWEWYHTNVGQEKCPIMDTWLQTEAGGFLISPLPITPLKPGSATLPFPGIVPKILREDGTECDAEEVGFLVITKPWPGMLRGFWNDPERKRFKQTYFRNFPGYYFTGDGAKRDEEGYFWIMGRIDGVIHISGHRIELSEVENALLSHPSVAEAAVISIPHEVKGQGIHVFVTLKIGTKSSEDLQKELLAHVRKVIGPIVTPVRLQFTDVLPKMRSSRPMRRILRKIAEEKVEELGDTSIDSRASLFYHAGHTWIQVEKADEIRVGLDYFLGRMIGGVKAVILPLPGNQGLQGENLCSIIQQEGILDIVFPVSGYVLSVNPKLKDQPELLTRDPLGDGYLLTLKPKNLQQDQNSLFFGEGALSWYRQEWERFKTAVISEFHHGQEPYRSAPIRVKMFKAAVISELHHSLGSPGMTMQDGEINLRDIKKSIGPERYIQLVSTFLRNGEKRDPS